MDLAEVEHDVDDVSPHAPHSKPAQNNNPRKGSSSVIVLAVHAINSLPPPDHSTSSLPQSRASIRGCTIEHSGVSIQVWGFRLADFRVIEIEILVEQQNPEGGLRL